MITFLRGILVVAIPSLITIDVSGVGYEVHIPLSCHDQLPATGSEVTILIHHHITDSDQRLYGFLLPEERDLFRLLIGRVSGVGPKIGLSVLGGMGVEAFKASVVSEDIAAISKVKGLGKKTAERIVLELKDKVGIAEAWEASQVPGSELSESSVWNDASLALISLGYKQSDAQKALGQLQKSGKLGDSPTTDAILREALQGLN